MCFDRLQAEVREVATRRSVNGMSADQKLVRASIYITNQDAGQKRTSYSGVWCAVVNYRTRKECNTGCI